MGKRNAIIMAAGTSSRFVPLSAEKPKGLIEVKGEILIERQIKQLIEAGVDDITLVVGYKAELFSFLREKYGISIVLNDDYTRYNNTSSIIRVIDRLDNTFVCSSDNYFPENVFKKDETDSFYSALYAEGETNEYCITVNQTDQITDVCVGGHNAWYMIGHVFFNREFSNAFRKVMIQEYEHEATRKQYWEDVYIRHIGDLPLVKINRYGEGEILEFDSLDELRLFDESYIGDTRSMVVKQIGKTLGVSESQIHSFRNICRNGDNLHFRFIAGDAEYEYRDDKNAEIVKI